MVRSARRLVFLVLMAALAGAVLLSSPATPWPGEPAPTEPGGVVGPANSVLRALLFLTTFNNTLPTEPSDRIKSLMLRGGATAMAVVALIAWGLSVRKPRKSPVAARTKSGGEIRAAGKVPPPGGEVGLGSAERDSLIGPANGVEAVPFGRAFVGRILGRRPTLLGWAGLVGVGWLAWSVLACRWSHSPHEATSFVETFAFVLALAAVAGATLDRQLVQRAGSAWLCVVAVVSALVLWRASDSPVAAATLFVGDSRTLAGLFVPGLVLAVVLLAWQYSERIRPDDSDPTARPVRRNRRRVALVLYGSAALLAAGAIFCCGSGPWRSAILAAIAGLGVSAVLLARGRWRMVASIAAAVVTPAIGWLLISTDRPSAVVTPDRLAQIVADRPMIDGPRWSLAGELIGRSPILGNGPWASRLLTDRLAEARSLTDPRWSTRPVVAIENFWLEQWADLGVVGVGLLLAALVVLTVAAGRAIDRCPWRQHRWLIGALVGGLIGLAVQEFFASSGPQPAFAAVAAAWAGLTAAATRWAIRHVPDDNDDPYTIGFHPGGLFFLAGAAVMLSAVGYAVGKDWTSACGQHQAVAEDILAAEKIRGQIQVEIADPRRQLDPAWQSVARGDLDRADRHMVAAVERLDDASRWSMDLQGRVEAEWQRARAAFEQINWQVAEQGDLQRAGLVEPPWLVNTAKWAEAILQAMGRLQVLDSWHPAGVPELAVSLAEGSLLIAHGRYLSYQPRPDLGQLQLDQNRILLGEVERAVGMSRSFLDQRLAENANPYDLPAALLREQIASPVMLAQRLAVPPRLADWLVSRCRLSISPADRVRLMRDSLRDFTVLAARSATWQIVITSPDWPPMETGWYDGLIRTALGMDIAQPALDNMIQVAQRVERDPSNEWMESPNADIRNAPQTFRLAAELILVARRIPQPAGLDPPAPTTQSASRPTSTNDGDDSDLKQADRFLSAAQRMYDRDHEGFGLFVIQALAVRLQRAQLAWFRGDVLAGERLAREACDRLPFVDEFHRPMVAQAAAAVRAFLLAQTDRPDEAQSWLRQTRFVAKGYSLRGFQSQVGSTWRGALTRQVIPPPTAQKGNYNTSIQNHLQDSAIDESPLFSPPGGDALWPTPRLRMD